MTDYGLDLAVIGNGRTAALLEPSSRIVWWCLPRYDGDPVFCRLLSGGEDKGFTDVTLEGQAEIRSNYVRNTAIVVTDLIDDKGAGVRITDFAPRFRQFGRMHRPPMIIRRVDRLEGLCRIRARIRPRMDYGRYRALPIAGSNHIRYVSEAGSIRLTKEDEQHHYIPLDWVGRVDQHVHLSKDCAKARRRWQAAPGRSRLSM